MGDVVIKIGFITELLRIGIREYATINLTKSPHLAVCANSGGGKSYLLSQILGRISLVPNSMIWLADYKNSGDYGKNLNSTEHRYYTRENYSQSIVDFTTVVNDRMEKRDMSRDLRILCLEEYGAFLNSLDKKQGEIYKKMVADLLYLARSSNCFLLLCSQRFFAEHLIFGSRDSICNVVLLADPSSESLQAFTTADERKLMKPHQQGEGYLIREGKNPLEITVATTTKQDKLFSAIERTLRRDESELAERVEQVE